MRKSRNVVREKNGKKRIVVLSLICLLATQVFAGGASAEAAGGRWKKDSKGWWYSYGKGSYAKNTWLQDGRAWYFFDNKGYMVTGWRKVCGKWYFFKNNGSMVTGWRKIQGSWYYFNKKGAMVTGWQRIGGKRYYFDPSGEMVTGTVTIKGSRYTFGDDGAWLEDPANHKHVYCESDYREATCLEDGYVAYECDECRARYTKTLPAIGHHTYGEEQITFENYEGIEYRSQKICIGYNGYNFYEHGYITGDEVMEKICYDIEHDVSEEEGGCGTYGYYTHWLYIPIKPGSVDVVTYRECEECGYKEQISSRHYTWLSDEESLLNIPQEEWDELLN